MLKIAKWLESIVMEFLGKSVQCIKIAEKGECYDVELPGNISYCIEGGSSGNTKHIYYVHCIEDRCGGWWKYFGMRNWKC